MLARTGKAGHPNCTKIKLGQQQAAIVGHGWSHHHCSFCRNIKKFSLLFSSPAIGMPMHCISESILQSVSAHDDIICSFLLAHLKVNQFPVNQKQHITQTVAHQQPCQLCAVFIPAKHMTFICVSVHLGLWQNNPKRTGQKNQHQLFLVHFLLHSRHQK